MKLSLWSNKNIENKGFLKKEINYYFKKIFGISIESVERECASIKLYIDYEAFDYNTDAISIEMMKGDIVIKANSKISLLIAIYRLFYEFGVRFLRPGKHNELIPKLTKDDFLNKNISIFENARFLHRGVCIEGATSFDNIKNFIDWLPKIGMNSFFIQFENPYPFLKRWYMHEFNPYLKEDEFDLDISDDMSEKIDYEIKTRGIYHHRVGHGWTGEVLGYSSKYGWENGFKLPNEMKPLVAEIDGKRELFKTAPILTSLDFANPDVAEKMIKIIIEYAKKRKDVDYLHIWLSDARNNICECDECKKELVSDQYIKILNKLDEKMTEENIDTKICFLLYHELLFAPISNYIKNKDRFTMMFAPITRTFEMSYEDLDYNNIPKPKEYERNNMVLPNSLEENLSYLFKWQETFDGDSFVYDYPLGRAHYGDLGYMHISKIIHKDIRYLDKLNLNGYISCQELRIGFPHNFPNYVMGKMLWNNNLDYNDIKREYFSSMYGDDFKTILTYFERLSANSSCDYFNSIGDRVNPLLSIKYEACSNVAYEFIKDINKNLRLTKGIQKKQWKLITLHRDYVIKMADALNLLSIGKESKAQVAWKKFLEWIRKNETEIQEILDVYRVIEVAKNYTGFKL